MALDVNGVRVARRASAGAIAAAAMMAAGVLAVGGCGSGGTQPLPTGRTVALGEEFPLAFQESVAVQNESLRVTMRGVPTENRCPIDAICVSDGNAVVAVGLARGGGAVTEARLNTNPQFGPTGTAYQGYTVRVVALSPYPRSSVATPQRDYVARLVVTKP